MLFFIRGTNKETRKHLRVDAVTLLPEADWKTPWADLTFL
jgi:hypothetical protein